MLEEITLKFTNSEDIRINPKGVVLFVGPNNSGKSLVLREIEQERTPNLLSHAQKDFKILKSLKSSPYKKEEKEKILPFLKQHTDQNGDFRIGKFSATGDHFEKLLTIFEEEVEALEQLGVLEKEKNLDGINKDEIFSSLKPHFETGKTIKLGNWDVNKHSLENWVTQFKNSINHLKKIRDWAYLLKLDGRSRFTLIQKAPLKKITGPSLNTFSKIYYEKETQKKIKEKIKDAFNKYFFIEITAPPDLEIRFSSKDFSGTRILNNPKYQEYYSNSLPITELSDGTQCFTGIITACYSNNYSTILLDEPEAFLHPPLVKKLGADLVSTMKKRKTSLLAATHSANFVMGCLQSSDNIEIIRLEYLNGKSKGYKVDSTKLKEFFNDPLIRNTNVISGLFYDGVVVTESDSDRVFYQEIYNKIIEDQKESTLPDILFINAQNKQTIPRIVKALRTFGIPTIGVADIDVIREKDEWNKFVPAFFFTKKIKESFEDIRKFLGDKITKLSNIAKAEGNFRKSIKELLELKENQEPISDSELRSKIKSLYKEYGSSDSWKLVKKEGFKTLKEPELLETSEKFLRDTKEYGMFIVPTGELESWLPDLTLTRGDKKKWIGQVFPKLAHMKPKEGDVWGFVHEMILWIQDSSRKGMDTTRGDKKISKS